MNSLEFYWGSVSLLWRALPTDTKISDWSVCDFIKSLQDNGYLHRLPFFFGTKLFQTSLLSEVVI